CMSYKNASPSIAICISTPNSRYWSVGQSAWPFGPGTATLGCWRSLPANKAQAGPPATTHASAATAPGDPPPAGAGAHPEVPARAARQERTPPEHGRRHVHDRLPPLAGREELRGLRPETAAASRMEQEGVRVGHRRERLSHGTASPPGPAAPAPGPGSAGR